MREILRPLESVVQLALNAQGMNITAEEMNYLGNTCRGFPARSTRSENPRPFSNGSTVAVTSSTGYRTVASP
ncbi:MAG TPA: hypothetical protein VF437_08630 [Verrucomicrobiae bacterium]|jgi:hypothetical protein